MILFRRNIGSLKPLHQSFALHCMKHLIKVLNFMKQQLLKNAKFTIANNKTLRHSSAIIWGPRQPFAKQILFI